MRIETMQIKGMMIVTLISKSHRKIKRKIDSLRMMMAIDAFIYLSNFD